MSPYPWLKAESLSNRTKSLIIFYKVSYPDKYDFHSESLPDENVQNFLIYAICI